jgi:biotin operon repressor
MKKLHRPVLKGRIMKLVTLKSTGRPTEMAVALEISERSVKRIIKEIRDEGTDIRYSNSRRSYVTDEEFQ